MSDEFELAVEGGPEAEAPAAPVKKPAAPKAAEAEEADEELEIPDETESEAEAEPEEKAEPEGDAEETTAETEDGEELDIPEEEEPEAEAAPEKAPAKAAADPRVQELEQVANWAHGVNNLINTSPKMRRAFWEELEARGELAPEYQERLDQMRAADGGAAKIAPPETEAEVRARARRLFAEGKEDEATDLIADLKQRPVMAKIGEWEKQREAEKRAAEDAARRAQSERVEKDTREQFTALAAKYPKLVVKDAKTATGVRFVNQKFLEKLREVSNDIPNASVKLERLAKLALVELGWLGTKRAPKPPTRSPKQSARQPQGLRLRDNEVALEVQ